MYKGPTPGVLLEPLFKQSSCSYRVSHLFCVTVALILLYKRRKRTNQHVLFSVVYSCVDMIVCCMQVNANFYLREIETVLCCVVTHPRLSHTGLMKSATGNM